MRALVPMLVLAGCAGVLPPRPATPHVAKTVDPRILEEYAVPFVANPRFCLGFGMGAACEPALRTCSSR